MPYLPLVRPPALVAARDAARDLAEALDFVLVEREKYAEARKNKRANPTGSYPVEETLATYLAALGGATNNKRIFGHAWRAMTQSLRGQGG